MSVKAAAGRVPVVVGLFFALMLSLSGGIAHADAYVGKTYADAAAVAADRNQQVTIVTIVGDVLDQSECMVVSARKATSVSDDNFDHRKGILFGLNCGAKLASHGLPGNSAMSPAGQAQGKLEAKVESINESTIKANGGPSWCSKNLDRCKTLCDQSGLCSEETLAILG